jgi:hypothetical protein
MFTGCKGGMSYKIIQPMHSIANNIMLIRVMEHLGYRLTREDKTVDSRTLGFPANLHGVTHWCSTTSVNVLEFTQPYNDQRRFFPTSCRYGATDEETKWVVLKFWSYGDFAIQLQAAGAADFSLVGFRFVPAIL